MARIRTIKPEFWTNPKVVNVSRDARLMFIGMWNYSDDYGRMAYEPLSIKLRQFPADADITVDSIKDMLNELSKVDLILIYSANGKEFIEVVGWDHQKIDRRQVSKLPAPFADDSEIRRIPPTPADSRRLPPTPADFPRWKGREGNGMEGNGGEGNSVAYATGAEAPPDPSAPERDLFARGKQVLGKAAGGQLAKLLSICGGNVALARSKIELAATKENPREFIAGVIRAGPQATARPMTVHQAKHAEGRAILNELHEFNTGTSCRTDTGVLRLDPGDGAESLRGGAGGNLVQLPSSRDRQSG